MSTSSKAFDPSAIKMKKKGAEFTFTHPDCDEPFKFTASESQLADGKELERKLAEKAAKFFKNKLA